MMGKYENDLEDEDYIEERKNEAILLFSETPSNANNRQIEELVKILDEVYRKSGAFALLEVMTSKHRGGLLLANRYFKEGGSCTKKILANSYSEFGEVNATQHVISNGLVDWYVDLKKHGLNLYWKNHVGKPAVFSFLEFGNQVRSMTYFGDDKQNHQRIWKMINNQLKIFYLICQNKDAQHILNLTDWSNKSLKEQIIENSQSLLGNIHIQPLYQYNKKSDLKTLIEQTTSEMISKIDSMDILNNISKKAYDKNNTNKKKIM